MPRYNRQEDFETGIELVTPFFKSHGYSLVIAETQVDKEGAFFLATFTSEPRAVELHHLYSLGPVIYRIGEDFIEHTPYLEALGVASDACYPPYEDDSRSGYAALLRDLQSLLSPFFVGSALTFSSAARKYMQTQHRNSEDEQPRQKYLSSLEPRMKASVRDLFMLKRFDLVAEMESQICYPEFLTDSERLMFSMARKHTKK